MRVRVGRVRVGGDYEPRRSRWLAKYSSCGEDMALQALVLLFARISMTSV